MTEPTAGRTALVIPGESDQSLSTITWTADVQLLDALYQAIGCNVVDIDCTLPIDGAGEICVWVSDDTSHIGDAPFNRRIAAFVRGLGQRRYGMYGTAVITGGADEDGDTLGLDAELLVDLQRVIA